MAEETPDLVDINTVKQDVKEALTDVFEPTQFDYEHDTENDILIATKFGDDGEVLARFAVSITVDLEPFNGRV